MRIKGEEIYANVWGGQKKVFLTTWEEIKKLGFKVRDRAFGNLNDGTFMPHACQRNTKGNVNMNGI